MMVSVFFGHNIHVSPRPTKTFRSPDSHPTPKHMRRHHASLRSHRPRNKLRGISDHGGHVLAGGWMGGGSEGLNAAAD